MSSKDRADLASNLSAWFCPVVWWVEFELELDHPDSKTDILRLIKESWKVKEHSEYIVREGTRLVMQKE